MAEAAVRAVAVAVHNVDQIWLHYAAMLHYQSGRKGSFFDVIVADDWGGSSCSSNTSIFKFYAVIHHEMILGSE